MERIRVNIYLREDVLQAIDEKAEAAGLSRSRYIELKFKEEARNGNEEE